MLIENRNKKLMFITVGTGKDGKDIAHGISFSIKNQNPEVVVLIASETSAKITFPFIKESLNKLGKQIQIDEKLYNEIDDFEKLHNAYFKLVTDYLNKGFNKNNIAVDYTSGTKAMSAALVSAAITAEVGTISYINGERKEGRVLSGTERASSINPNSIFSAKLLNKFIGLFNSYQFGAALSLLDDFEIHPKYIAQSNILKELTLLFSCWDKFNFTLAWQYFLKIPPELIKEFSLKSKFEKLYSPLLMRLKEDSISVEKINDLIFNAYRRAEEGKFDDAVARLYRTLEMIGQLEFLNTFHCSTDDAKLENLPINAKEFVMQKKSSENKKIMLGLDLTFRTLNIVKNPLGVLYVEKYSIIKQHLEKRNFSILAHGSNPISQNSFQSFFSFIVDTFSVGPKGNIYPDFSFPKINLTF